MSSERASGAVWMIRASSAVFGGALAVGLGPSLLRAAGPSELPGALPAEGLSSSDPIVQFAVFLLFVFGLAIAGNFVAPRLAGVRWATVSFCAALLSSPIPLMYFGHVRHVALHGVVAVAIVFFRNLNPRFSMDDVVLLPAFLSCYFAFLDIGFGGTVAATFVRAAIALFALRLVVGWLSKNPRPALAFALTPLAFAFQIGWLPPAVSGTFVLGWVFGTCFLLASLQKSSGMAAALRMVIYPVALCLYPIVLIGVNSDPHVNVFEDTHDLLAASEMVRGEKPYIDVLPTHGFLADGGIDWVAMKFGADDAGKVMRARMIVATASVAAMYFTALAATGSSAAACLAVFLAFALFPGSTFWWRVGSALFSLASLVCAVRLRSERWLIVAGAFLGLTLLTSVDFAAYTAIVVLFVVARWPARLRAAGLTGVGFAAVVLPAIALFALDGFATAFFRGTVEVVRAGRVFVSRAFEIPECLRSPSALIWQLPDSHCFSAVLWVVAVVLSAAALARSPFRMRRGDAVWIVGVWLAVTGFAWAERQHAYYGFALTPFVVATLFRFRRHRSTVTAIAVALILLVRPFAHLFEVATPLRRAGGLPSAGWVEVHTPARAGHAVFAPETATGLAVMDRYLRSQMRPGETFFDFANAGILYYLFNRDCPIPQIAVPFYEEESQQREVIAAIDRNRRVRAVLLDFPGSFSDIDGVPNSQRAPLVWEYLQQHFAPALEQDGVVIWKRR